MSESQLYSRRNLELRAAEFYVSIRKPESTWRSLKDLEPQLNEIVHRIQAGDYNAVARVLEYIDYRYLYLWGHYRRLSAMRKCLIDNLTDQEARIVNLIGFGRVLRVLGQTEQAIEYLELAVTLAREDDNPHSECEALYQLGFARRNLGQIQRAVQCFESSLRLAYTLGDTTLEITRAGSLIWFYLAFGQFELASTVAEKTLATAQRNNDYWEESVNLTRLGHIYYAYDQPERAINSYSQALRIARETDMRINEAVNLGYLGQSYQNLGRWEEALENHRQGLKIARGIGDLWNESYQLLQLGKTMLRIGEPAQAKDYCTQALQMGFPETDYQAALMLGIVFLHLKCFSLAEEAVTESIARCKLKLKEASMLYMPSYALATALTCQIILDPRWTDTAKRADLLAPTLTEFERALEITAAPGVVHDALRDLELIRNAGVEGLEPVFALLERALNDNAPVIKDGLGLTTVQNGNTQRDCSKL